MVRALAPYHPEENITHGGSYITKEVHDKIKHVQYAEKYKVYESHRLPPSVKNITFIPLGLNTNCSFSRFD